ncbi:hypothetical protein HPP92_023274 [Vanilla planifolia]|uniref:Uncharacterized protein n=1 Tax=Vanilla planifolia TaxID=51239 RepID=A0A835PTN5_VANPL|nr:hypothetical protein HPP92_023573 [Vanilla planifolia]KAG0460146.1 hypothetical protein HPP92_023274 [Vanilla planifolia]
MLPWAIFNRMDRDQKSELSARSARRSMETLVVVVAAIVIVVVLAGMLARVCGGRRLSGGGDEDVEGWVERRCRSCIDSGIPSSAHSAAVEGTATGEIKK